MNSKDELNAIEDRILDLEYIELKRQVALTRFFSITPRASATKRSEAPSALTISTHRSSGATSYLVRYNNGTTANLPADRKNWPADIRSMVENIELADKQRSRNGRLISAAI